MLIFCLMLVQEVEFGILWSKMATGAVPASFTGLKSRDHCGLGFGKSSDFVRVSDLQRVKFGRSKVAVIRNSNNPSSETVELKPASEGSPLLGIYFLFHMVWFCSLRSDTWNNTRNLCSYN